MNSQEKNTDRDASGRRDVEEELRASEAKYHLMFAGNPQPMMIYDLDTLEILEVNEAAADHYGFSIKEFLTMSIRDIRPAEDIPLLLRDVELSRSGINASNESRHRKKNGELIWVVITAHSVVHNGRRARHVLIHDITERKRIENALRESEERQRLILESLPVAIYSSPVDSECDTTWISGDVIRITGFDVEEYLKENDFWRKRLHPDDKDRVLYSFAQLPFTKEATIEYRWKCKDGQYHWFQDRTVFLENQSRKEYLGVILDITERKHLELRLHEGAARYRNIVENLSQAYYEADQRSIFRYGNPGIFLVSGYSEEELVGISAFRMVAKEHRAKVSETYKQWVKEQPSEMFLEFLVQKKNGEKFWVEQTTHFEYDNSGQFIKASNVLKNIHERKLAEEKLRDSENTFRGILNSIDEAVYIQDDEGRFLDVNMGAEKLYGYERHEFLGRTAEFLSAPGRNDLAALGKNFEKVLAGDAQAFEFWGVAKNGRTFLKEVHLYPGDYFGVKCIIAVAQDISERKATEQLLRDMQRRESIGVMSGGIAHDFNNLLGSMMGNISLAQSRLFENHPAISNLKNALSAAERAARLTQQLLAYSGKGKFQVRTIDVGNVIREHVSLFMLSLPKNVKLVTNLPPSPVYINGDPGQIEQIVMNMIINGGEAIGHKQGVVTITLTSATMGSDGLLPSGWISNTVLSAGNYLLLEITDNGIGMSRETISRIFDPFFTTKFTGRGLGLSAVLGIIQGHKGDIMVESTEGTGTTFRIVLPVSPEPMPEGETASAVKSNEAGSTAILIIDDEEEIATMAQEILEAGNYTAFIELNPIMGIECYRRRRSEIGLVLLDMTMPEMSGKEVIDALRAIDPKVKIIISSGYSEDEVDKKIGRAKVSGFIQKPYHMKSLLSIVESVMH